MRLSCPKKGGGTLREKENPFSQPHCLRSFSKPDWTGSHRRLSPKIDRTGISPAPLSQAFHQRRFPKCSIRFAFTCASLPSVERRSTAVFFPIRPLQPLLACSASLPSRQRHHLLNPALSRVVLFPPQAAYTLPVPSLTAQSGCPAVFSPSTCCSLLFDLRVGCLLLVSCS